MAPHEAGDSSRRVIAVDGPARSGLGSAHLRRPLGDNCCTSVHGTSAAPRLESVSNEGAGTGWGSSSREKANEYDLAHETRRRSPDRKRSFSPVFDVVAP